MSPRQTVTHLGVDELVAHPANIRAEVGDVDELALSIRANGILQPLTVTEAGDGRWLLLAGHRRLAAARKADLARVPVIIRHGVDDEGDQIALMLVENCQRRDLGPVEKAEAFGALFNRGLSVSAIARKVGVSQPTVSRYLALLELPEEEREELRDGAATVSDLLALIRDRRMVSRRRVGGGPIGRPKGKKTKPHFGDSHPLARTVRSRCSHRGRVKVGGVGCGPCWEEAIRETAGGGVR